MHQISIITHKESIGMLLAQFSTQTLRRRIARILKHPLLAHKIKSPVSLCLTLTNDDEICILNSQYRHQNKATDVLSFALGDGEEMPIIPGIPLELGDIIISIERASLQAKKGALPRLQPYLKKDWSLSDEVSFLMLHGLLHLLGYDHIEDQEALEMEYLEQQLLPYLLGYKYTQRA